MNSPASMIENICSVEKWSVWSQSNRNLSLLRNSMANAYGIQDHCIIHDVHPLVSQQLTGNIGRLACTIDAAYLADGEVHRHPAHCKHLPRRASYVANDKKNGTDRLVRPRDEESCHKDIPHLTGAGLSSSRMILIDTGASYDMINRHLVDGRMPGHVRDLIKPTNINIANGKAKVTKGVRIRTAPWDCVTDAILLEDSLNLKTKLCCDALFLCLFVINNPRVKALALENSLLMLVR